MKAENNQSAMNDFKERFSWINLYDIQYDDGEIEKMFVMCIFIQIYVQSNQLLLQVVLRQLIIIIIWQIQLNQNLQLD